MMSDGVSRFTEFGIGSWPDLLTILSATGPADLFARIRQAEDGDPAGARWPRAKQHDDVSLRADRSGCLSCLSSVEDAPRPSRAKAYATG
jgi:hypothetical protein